MTLNQNEKRCSYIQTDGDTNFRGSIIGWHCYDDVSDLVSLEHFVSARYGKLIHPKFQIKIFFADRKLPP